MDIYIEGNLPKSNTDKGSNIKLRIPVLPSEITCNKAVTFSSYNILDRGEVKIPNGRELEEISWESFFPGESRKGQPWILGEWKSPKTLTHYFNVWINYGVKLFITISGTNISNKAVYVSSFEWKPSGGFGDIQYSIVFVQAKDIIVTSATNKSNKRTSKAKSTTYTVKKGDTLFKIAKKFYGKGSYYTKIYNANKKVIESAAKKHGKKSSNKGKLIYPGTKLTIPSVSGSSGKSSNGKVTYYPKYKGKSGYLVEALKSLKIDSSMSNRKKIAKLNGISNYTGTASQNIKMLKLLKNGKLIKSK